MLDFFKSLFEDRLLSLLRTLVTKHYQTKQLKMILDSKTEKIEVTDTSIKVG